MKPKASDSIKKIIAGMNDLATASEDADTKARLNASRDEIVTLLASLPKDEAEDKTPEALAELASLSQRAMDQVIATATAATSGMATLKASIPAEVTRAIDAEVAKGELVKKSDVESQIKSAVTQAREGWDTERKTVATRLTTLASLNLPAPDEAQLTGSDDEFKAKSDKAKSRLDAVKDYKVAPARLLTLCWAADDATFDATVELLKENAGTQKASPAPVGGKTAGAKKPSLFGI